MTQTLTPAIPVESSRLVLHHISWEMYEKLLEIFAEHPKLRMTYYKETLELMKPLSDRERYSWTLGRLLVVLSEELGSVTDKSGYKVALARFFIRPAADDLE